jgi:hypothetical protein
MRTTIVAPLLITLAIGMARAAPAQVSAPRGGGTSTISGTVVSASTGRPLAGAQVSLTRTSDLSSGGPALPGRGGTMAAGGTTVGRPWTHAVVVTDASGRFAFGGLPGGRFVLDASRDQFLPASYGQRQPGRPGQPLELQDGQSLALRFEMVRGGAIVGTVFDEAGDRVVHASVRALRHLTNQNGVTRLRVVDATTTDDRGTYRFYQLLPGTYFVSAAPQTLPPTPQIDDGVAPIVVGAIVSPTPAFAPTYHPMSPTASRGSSIEVDGTSERAGIDIHLQPTLMGSIRGTVSGHADPALPVQVLLHNVDGGEEPTSLSTRIDATGAFVFDGVPPGSYMVYAQTLPPPDTAGGSVEAIRASRFDRLHGRTATDVIGGAPTNVAIVLRAGRSISGRIRSDATQPPGPGASGGVVISITPAPQPAGLPAFNTSPRVQVGADGTFTLPGIRPGRFFLRASGPGIVRSVMWNGVDTLDFPLEITADADVTGVVVELTDRMGAVAGTIANADGTPAWDRTVVLAASDSRFWVPGNRRVAISGLSADGRYRFDALPAGQYRLAVIDTFDPADRFDPRFLQRVVADSVAVTISDGVVQTRDVRLPR